MAKWLLDRASRTGSRWNGSALERVFARIARGNPPARRPGPGFCLPPGRWRRREGGHVRLWLGNRALGGLPKRIQSLRAEVGEAYSLGLGLGFHDLETHSESPVGFPQG